MRFENYVVNTSKMNCSKVKVSGKKEANIQHNVNDQNEQRKINNTKVKKKTFF